MKKEPKKYHVVVTLHRLSDYESPTDQIIDTREYYRYGVSEKQVISRLKWEQGLKNFDGAYGSVAYDWRFDLEEVVPVIDNSECGFEQLSIFDIL